MAARGDQKGWWQPFVLFALYCSRAFGAEERYGGRRVRRSPRPREEPACGNRLERREIRRRSGPACPRSRATGPGRTCPSGTDLLPQIKHIVVLMMENHSYDNYLGTLPAGATGCRSAPDGAPGRRQLPTPEDGSAVPAHHLTSTSQVPDDPGQSWHASHIQFATGATTGSPQRGAGRARRRSRRADGLLDRGGPAVLLRAGADVPAGRPLVLLLPGPDVPEPPVPDRRHRPRPDRRPALGHRRLPGGRDDLRHADQARDLLGQLPQRAPTGVCSSGCSAGRAARRPAAGPARPVAAGSRQDRAAATSRSPPTCTRSGWPAASGTSAPPSSSSPTRTPARCRAFSIVDPDFGAYSEENPQDIRKGESFAAEVIKRSCTARAGRTRC